MEPLLYPPAPSHTGVRAMASDPAASSATPPADASGPRSIVIRFDRRKHTIAYEPGDTILDTARRAGLNPPFACQMGNCATCMAHLDAGEVAMRVNEALDDDEVAEGWILTCQAVPISHEVVVDYDR